LVNQSCGDPLPKEATKETTGAGDIAQYNAGPDFFKADVYHKLIVFLLYYKLSIFHPVSTLVSSPRRFHSYDLFDHRNVSEHPHMPIIFKPLGKPEIGHHDHSGFPLGKTEGRLKDGMATMLKPL
jgi:hypothetical protein